MESLRDSKILLLSATIIDGTALRYQNPSVGKLLKMMEPFCDSKILMLSATITDGTAPRYQNPSVGKLLKMMEPLRGSITQRIIYTYN
jgi:hypothetical protein